MITKFIIIMLSALSTIVAWDLAAIEADIRAITAIIIALFALVITLGTQFEVFITRLIKLYILFKRRKIPEMLKAALKDGKLSVDEIMTIITNMTKCDEKENKDEES